MLEYPPFFLLFYETQPQIVIGPPHREKLLPASKSKPRMIGKEGAGIDGFVLNHWRVLQMLGGIAAAITREPVGQEMGSGRDMVFEEGLAADKLKPIFVNAATVVGRSR